MLRVVRPVAVALLLCSLLVSGIACRSRSDTGTVNPAKPAEPTPDQLVTGLAASAEGEPAAFAAVQALVSRSLSLGALDSGGSQINGRKLPAEAPSLAGADLEALAYLQHCGHATTIAEVIGYASAASVTLTGHTESVTATELLPLLQTYVSWSFDRRADPRALLGLCIATPPGAAAPPSVAPTLTTETLISPTAALLLLADILVGVAPEYRLAAVEDGSQGGSGGGDGKGIRRAHAAPAGAGAVARIQGLVAEIEPLVKPLVDASALSDAKRLLAAYALGNRFAVRLLYQDTVVPLFGIWVSSDSELRDFSVAKSISLTRKQRGHWLVATVVLVPSGEIVQRLSVNYALRLLSAENAGLVDPTFTDADVRIALPSHVGYQRGEQAYNRAVNPGWYLPGVHAQIPLDVPLGFMVGAGALENPSPHVALLHCSASIKWVDLEPWLDQYGGALMIMGFDLAELREVYTALQRDTVISPWVLAVAIPASLGRLDVSPPSLGAEVDTEYAFAATAEEDMPAEAEYDWQIDRLGEGGERVRVESRTVKAPDNSLKVSFASGGEYEVSVALRNTKSGERHAVGTAEVSVKPRAPGAIGLRVTATPQVQETAVNIAFRAEPAGDSPALGDKAIWQWSFGDGGAGRSFETYSRNADGQLQAGTVSYAYATAGRYSVAVKLLDAKTGAVLASAATEVTVDDIPAVQATTALRATVSAWWTVQNYTYPDGKETVSSTRVLRPVGLMTEAGVLSWDGLRFEASPLLGLVDAQSAYGLRFDRVVDEVRYAKIWGVVSDDARTLLELHVRAEAVNTRDGVVLVDEMSFANVPLVKLHSKGESEFRAAIRGESVGKYLVSRKYELRELGSSPGGEPGRLLQRLLEVDWGNQPQDPPRLDIELRLRPPEGGWRL